MTRYQPFHQPFLPERVRVFGPAIVFEIHNVMRSYSEFLIISHLNFGCASFETKVCELNHLRAALHKPRHLAVV